jgi:hypothetical protein
MILVGNRKVTEPDGRISRIRLSGRWFYLKEE